MKNKSLLMIGMIIFLVGFLIFVNASTFQDLIQGDFDSGTYFQTGWNSTSNFVWLAPSNTSGNYTSQIFNAGSSSTWNNISWVSNAIGELPANQVVETSFGSGNANMTGNVLLMHLNNDSAYGENDTHVYDFSGNGHNGTVFGDGDEAVSSGKLNGAIEFDGAGDYIVLEGTETGGANPLELNDSFTISLWANAKESKSSYVINNYDRDHFINLDSNVNGLVVDYRLYVDDAVHPSQVTTSRIPLNEWHHIVAVRSKDNYVKIYVDGIENGTSADLITGSILSTEDWTLGSTSNGQNIEFFNGTIDEVGIWNRSLSETEIFDIYKRGALRLNLSVQSCDDDVCSGESWTNLGNNLTSPQNLSVDNNTYFQYKFYFETDDASYSPELYNVSLDYVPLTRVPTVTLNSPLNNSYQNDVSSVLLNATIYDEDLDNMTLWFYGGYANGTYVLINTTYNQTNGTSVTYNWTGLNDLGLYNWTVIVNDGIENSTNEYFFFNLINLTVNCEAGGGYQQGGLVLAQGNISDGTSVLTSHSVNLTVYDAFNNLDGSANLTSADDGGFETTFSELSVGSYTLYVNATYQGFNKTCTDIFVVGSPADFVLDKIVTIQNMTNTTINYNITLRVVNKGGSDVTGGYMIDSDSTSSPYDLTTVSANSSVVRSYIKSYTRNSTTYNSTLVQARVNGTDPYTGNEIEANSTEIVLIVPATTSEQQVTLIKNAYYNSENSTTVNYTISIEVVNSGGVDLSSITVIDSDLSVNTVQSLNRTQNYTSSGIVLVDKAASNTNKLFVKSSATVNAVTYQSNQINVRIPGYGGPADAIVYAPASVVTSTSFDTVIYVENQNPDIGQDFTIEYWITNVAEDTNHTSGEQTIYVASSGNSNLTAGLTSPSGAGDYRYRAIVSWTGGTATAYDTFSVTAPAVDSGDSDSGGSSGGGITGGVIYESDDEDVKIGVTKQLKDNDKIKFNVIQENEDGEEIFEEHSLEIIDLKLDSVFITIYSEPISFRLNVDKNKSIDLNNDSYYDIYVRLDKIENNNAYIYLKTIYEEVEIGEWVENVEEIDEIGKFPSAKPEWMSNIWNKIKSYYWISYDYVLNNKIYFIYGGTSIGGLLFVLILVKLVRMMFGKKRKIRKSRYPKKKVSFLEAKIKNLKSLKRRDKISDTTYHREKARLLQRMNNLLRNKTTLITLFSLSLIWTLGVSRNNMTGFAINNSKVIVKGLVGVLYFAIIMGILGVLTFTHMHNIKKVKTNVKEKIKNKLVKSKNRIKGLVRKKVYTTNGNYIGKVKEVILGDCRIDSLNVKLIKKLNKNVKGIVLKFKDVKSVGHIVIIEDKIMEKINF